MNLYDIEFEIEKCFDEETGEILNEEKLTELSVERDKKIDNIACFIKNLKAEAEAIKAEEDKLKKRREVAVHKAERLSDYLQTYLAGELFKSPRVAIGYHHSVSVAIKDENTIPEAFKAYTVKVDKIGIRNALKRGEAVDGAELVNNVSMVVR